MYRFRRLAMFLSLGTGPRYPSQSVAYRARKQREYRRDPNSFLNQKRLLNLLLFDVLRAVPCADCGGRFPATCMDFDHLPGHTKTTEVSVLAHGNYYPSRLLDEVSKCQVVCSNCHRVRTKDRLYE